MKIETYCGGDLQTNCYFIPEIGALFDAPDTAADWISARGWKVRHLVLTHGHFDHIMDGARIVREHGAKVYIHQADEGMITDGDIWKKFGWPIEVESFRADTLVPESEAFSIGETLCQTFHIPGHSPGSICYYFASAGQVMGGDVLFRGGVGRWDLPGGSRESLVNGIRAKLLPLPESTVVYPGHGPETTIGREKVSNPFLQ